MCVIINQRGEPLSPIYIYLCVCVRNNIKFLMNFLMSDERASIR